MNLERMNQWIATMETVKKERKNLRMKVFAVEGFAVEGEEYCGTAACAAGWMGLDPVHQKQGFTTHFGGLTGSVSYEERTENLYAVAEYLNITLDQASYICDPYRYIITKPSKITTDMVIRRIKKVTEENAT